MNEHSKIFIKTASFACIIACVGDFLALFFLGNYYPGYSQLRNTMSALGASISPVSNEISTWWIIAGFLFIFFAIGFKKAFSKKGLNAKIAFWLIILYAIGEEIGSGVFRTEVIGNTLSKTNSAHNVFGGIGILAILLLPLFIKRMVSKVEMPFIHAMSKVVFILGLLIILLFSLRIYDDKNNVFYIYKGFWQRLLMLVNYIYLITIAFIMLYKKPDDLKDVVEIN